MEMLWLWLVIQAAVIGLMFLMSRKARKGIAPEPKKPRQAREESREMRELRQMRARSLNLPLSEKARPAQMDEIIGQEDGIRALRAALCGPNPQHVLIYGPPGCGKTCAARLVLDEAKRCPDSPFDADSRFVEVDATCVRFDERAIADPLLGSVHDPIYQGAGALGAQGVPQPKPGAVSRAHCGVLFLDEIGELHPVQMNKLLKVLEDRKVFFESAYYSNENTSIPRYIHDIFQNGMPADFRLVGATTRRPEELPAALRSRCVELYFKPLNEESLARIARGAAERLGYEMSWETGLLLASYCESGRDAVNLVQLAGGAAYGEGRHRLEAGDVRWVAQISNCQVRTPPKLPERPRAGVAVGLAVTGGGVGMAVEIECTVENARNLSSGTLDVGGAVDYEELELRGRKLGRKGTAKTSAENVLGAFRKCFGWDYKQFDVRFNIPGGLPMDGPSAGIALAVALMSAISGKAPIAHLALTGEITVQGEVRPVGGVREKIGAALSAGAKTVLIPKANWEDSYAQVAGEVTAVADIAEVMRVAFDIPYEAVLETGLLPFLCTSAG
ncbi:MAG: S16 family serine protease [Candidatus Pelethousia sp.]|nr:S16 family serine protease [Candidatus Pelethousia sp.]